MSYRIPLVLDDYGQKQRLQPGDDLSLPVNDRVYLLEQKLKTLIEVLVLNGLDIPNEIL